MPERIAVIGGGSWGTAISTILAENKHEINLWVFEKSLCESMKEKRENTLFLPGIALPSNISPTNSLCEAVTSAKVIVIVVPTQHLRGILPSLAPHIPPDAVIVSASKGIEIDTLKTVSQILEEMLPKKFKNKISVISGPNFAREIANKLPAAASIASKNKEIAGFCRNIFVTPWFKLFVNTDPVGVELGGALKNVIAISAGIADGLDLGLSTRATLITRGLVEISRLGEKLGAQKETFLGLSGVGDLVLTCTGDLSRNRTVGMSLAKGKTIEEIQKDMQMVAEGVYTVKSAFHLGEKLGVRISIIEEVYKIIYEKKDIHEAISDLLAREIIDEF